MTNRRHLLKGIAATALVNITRGFAWVQAAVRQPRPFTVPRLLKPRNLPKPPKTVFFAPAPPAYPYADLDTIAASARGLSDALESYIRAWAAGDAPDVLPDAFVPPGVSKRDFRNFRLIRPEEARPDDQWVIRPSESVSVDGRFRGFFPDPNCTYIVAPAVLAPFGARLIIEGEFPHARFFDIQVTPSFDPRSYRYDAAGVGEVPIVDADIDPLPGHSNPFRLGADRDAARRGYRVEYDLAIGDPVQANLAFRPPHFRGAGNRRTGGALLFRGPWGVGGAGGDGRGAFGPGEVWVRYYRPDRIDDSLGGVPLPRVWCELATGERFWIQPDQSNFVRRINRRVKPRAAAPKPDRKRGEGPEAGWWKQAGIFRAVIAGIAGATDWGGPEYVRLLDRGVAGRGSDLPAPNNYEQSSTSATYIDYLTRGMSCARKHVVVLTGRLPTFPDTAGGESMRRAQMRYWSLVGYVVPEGLFAFLGALSADAVQGVATHAVRDDELTLDAERFYVIALSRPGDRPRNARPEAGVTWVDWGPAGKISWTVRWLSVGPEWKGPMMPTPALLGRRGEWGEADYDSRAISTNGWGGAIGEYLPRVGYMSTEDFEALGDRVRARDVPDWR